MAHVWKQLEKYYLQDDRTPKLKHPVDTAALVKTNQFHQKSGRLARKLTETITVPIFNWSNTKKAAESQVKPLPPPPT